MVWKKKTSHYRTLQRSRLDSMIRWNQMLLCHHWSQLLWFVEVKLGYFEACLRIPMKSFKTWRTEALFSPVSNNFINLERTIWATTVGSWNLCQDPSHISEMIKEWAWRKQLSKYESACKLSLTGIFASKASFISGSRSPGLLVFLSSFENLKVWDADVDVVHSANLTICSYFE